jgi:DNA invertase Pin-like site-specific DNA recombinase
VRKAVGYLRASDDAQTDRDGFPSQEASVRAYAKARGIKLARLFNEKSVTGTDRPAFIAMMEALHSNGVRLVLVESLARLAGDLTAQECVLHDLKRHGFELVSVLEPDLCGDDPDRKLMRTVLRAFEEYEKRMVVVKLRAARRRAKLNRGTHEGRKAYGYYAGEAETLNRIFELARAGRNATDIAKTLNSEGRTSRNGKGWLQPTVSKILNRSRSNSGPRIARSKSC